MFLLSTSFVSLVAVNSLSESTPREECSSPINYALSSEFCLLSYDDPQQQTSAYKQRTYFALHRKIIVIRRPGNAGRRGKEHVRHLQHQRVFTAAVGKGIGERTAETTSYLLLPLIIITAQHCREKLSGCLATRAADHGRHLASRRSLY